MQSLSPGSLGPLPPNPVIPQSVLQEPPDSLNLEELDKTACSKTDWMRDAWSGPAFPRHSEWGWRRPEAQGVLGLFFLRSLGPPFCRFAFLPTILLSQIPLAQCLVQKRGSQVSHLSVGGLFCVHKTSHCVGSLWEADSLKGRGRVKETLKLRDRERGRPKDTGENDGQGD